MAKTHRTTTPVTGPRWLTPDEQSAWRGLISMNLLLWDALDRQLREASGMSHSSYMLLALLSEAPGRSLRMSELAAATRYSMSRISHAVARLEEAGWVRRTGCPTDRRGAIAVLTDAGYDAVVGAAPGHVEAIRQHLFDQLTSAQVDQLAGICSAALRKLGPCAPPSPGP